ncbi:MAG: hypothetical protein QNJ90_00355 [Planctomycetota bacterium]|nr:hypothetical protein [Planctomycetota bacterium]
MVEPWVTVMQTDATAVPQVLDELRQAGISARVEVNNPHIRQMVPDRRFRSPDSIQVRASDVDQAREVLAEHMQEGEARISKHMRDLPGEIAIGVCLVCVVAFLVSLDTGGWPSAWPWAFGFGIAAPLAWDRMRKRRKKA